MVQTLKDVLGENATTTGTTITIDLADLNPLLGDKGLDDIATASDIAKVATLIAGIASNTLVRTDAAGTEFDVPDNAIVSRPSFSPKNFVNRGGEDQIEHQFQISVYTDDTSDFDPDNTI